MSHKKVLSIGQCGADHARLSHTIESNFDVTIVTSDDQADAIEKIKNDSFALVMINRILDQTGTEGLAIIRQIKPTNDTETPPIMLVSNFEDAQQSAIESGAVPGFGKAAIGDDATVKLLENYLGG